MKIVIDLYDLGFKLHYLTEDEINIAVEQHPEYRDRVWAWKESLANNICDNCALKTECKNNLRSIKESTDYCCNNNPQNFNLQPYFKRR